MKRIIVYLSTRMGIQRLLFNPYRFMKAFSAVFLVLVLLLNLIFDISLRSTFVFASPGHGGDHANEETLTGTSSEFPIVDIQKAQSAEDFDQSIEASGEIFPYQESDVYALRDGIVQELYVNVGDVVTKGQVLGYLYPDVQQSILNAELKLAQVQQSAAQKRRDFLKDIPEVQRKQIQSSLNFAQEGLELAQESKNKTLSQISTTFKVTQQEIESAKIQHDSKLAQLDVQISTAQQRLSQQELSAVNGISDVISSIESLLYQKSGVITSNAYSNASSLRRFGVYNQDSNLFSEVDIATRNFYRDFVKFQQQDSDEKKDGEMTLKSLLDTALELSQDARILSNKAIGITSTEDQISEIKSGVDESIDHLVELSDGVIDALSVISNSEAEKLQLSTSLEQELVRLNGDLSKLNQEKGISQAEQKTFVSERQSSVEDIERQLDIFSKGVEQQFLESDLNVAIQDAQVQSIRQKIGAGRAIMAPFSGTISRRFVNDGDSVDFGRPVYQMINDEQKFIRFFVREADMVFIDQDLIVDFSSTSTASLRARAKIVRISPTLDQETRTVLIEADLIEDDFTRKMLSHMNVRVQVPVSNDSSIWVIQESALELSPDANSIWIVNQDVEIERKEIEILFHYDGYAYLRGDLEKSWIVTKSPVVLEEGLAVDTAL